MQTKPVIEYPIIVEGKYDKAHITSLFDCYVITTDGFGIFKEKEKTSLIKKLADAKGVIVLTDSDGGGLVIRNYLKNIIPSCNIINLYIPQIVGKEKRKKEKSKEGFLGVEGVKKDIINNLLLPYSTNEAPINKKGAITKQNLYADGYIGKEDSSEKRKQLMQALDLPTNISTNALIDAINTLSLQEKYQEYNNAKKD